MEAPSHSFLGSVVDLGLADTNPAGEYPRFAEAVSAAEGSRESVRLRNFQDRPISKASNSSKEK